MGPVEVVELMINHKVHFGRLAFVLFLISIAAGAFWKYGLRGPFDSRRSRFCRRDRLPQAGSLSVTDLSPKFLAFYEQAVKEKASGDARWELWKKMYHFAAVPPTTEGDKMARDLLDRAWDRYPSALEQIRLGATSVGPVAEQ